MDFIFSHLIDILFTIITASVIYLFKKIKNLLKTIQDIRKSILNIIKSSFITKYYFYEKQNHICLYEKESINKLYLEYKKLGGSGIVDELYIKLNRLPYDEEGDLK